MSHSVILVNLSGPVIVGHRLYTRRPVDPLELSGCGVALLGSILFVLDTSSEKANPEDQNLLLGDSIALIGSLLCAVWMVKNSQIVSVMPPLFGMSLIMLLSNLMLTLLGLAFYDRSSFTLDTDPRTGAFGYWASGDALYVVLVYGLFTGACNMGAYSMSLRYFSPLVVGTAVLFEPIGSQALGCLLGLDKVPGPLTLLGTAVTLAGLYFVARGSQRSAQQTFHL